MEAPYTPPNCLMSLALAAHEVGFRSEPSSSRVQDLPKILDDRPDVRYSSSGQLTPPQSPERVKRFERGIRLPPISDLLKELETSCRLLPTTNVLHSMSFAGYQSRDSYIVDTGVASRRGSLALPIQGHQNHSYKWSGSSREGQCNNSAAFFGNSFSSATSIQAWSPPRMQQGPGQPYSPASTRAVSLHRLSPSRTLSPDISTLSPSITSTQASNSLETTVAKTSIRKEPYDDDEIYAMIFIKEMTLSWESLREHFKAIFPPGVARRCTNKSAKRCPPLYCPREISALQCRLYRARTKLELEPLRDEKNGEANRRLKKYDTRNGVKSAASSTLPSARGKQRRQYAKAKDALAGLVAQHRVSPEVVRLCQLIAERSDPKGLSQ